MFKFIKDIIAPKKCYSCGKEGHFLGEKCFEKIEKKYYFDEMCYVCKKYSTNFEVHKNCRNKVFYDKIIVLTHYRIKVIKKLILDFKFYFKKEIGEEFAGKLADKFIKYSKEELKKYKKEDFVVINVPTSFIRTILRGYNQTEILAKNFADLINLEFTKNFVLKSKYSKHQIGLKKEQRLKNLQNSFKINKKIKNKIEGKIVVLVDDVVTTGTTLNRISKILKDSGAKKIICITIASGY